MAPPPAPYAGSTSVPLLGDLPFVGSLFRSRSLGSEAGEAGYHFISDSSSGHTERRSVSDAARGLTIETEEEERTTDGLEIASASITVTEAQPVPDPETGELTYVITRRPMATVRIAEVPAHAGR
jgi:hypothetical protein